MEPPKLFEPYRKDKTAWDYYIFTTITALIGARNLDALIGGVALIVFFGLLLLWVFLLYVAFRGLAAIYRARAFSGTRSGYILQGTLAVCLLTLVLSMVLYDYDIISWGVSQNGLGFSWLVFVLVSIGVEKYEKYIVARRAPPQLPDASPNIASYLKWKPKQPSPPTGGNP